MANSRLENIGPLLVGDRPLPHSLEAERAVISCLLQDTRNTIDLVFAKLRTEKCFYSPAHRTIYNAMSEMRSEMVVSQIDPKNVLLEEPIKMLGVYPVELRLRSEVTATLKVWVVRA